VLYGVASSPVCAPPVRELDPDAPRGHAAAGERDLGRRLVGVVAHDAARGRFRPAGHEFERSASAAARSGVGWMVLSGVAGNLPEFGHEFLHQTPELIQSKLTDNDVLAYGEETTTLDSSGLELTHAERRQRVELL